MLQRCKAAGRYLLAGLLLLSGAGELLAATDIQSVRLWRAPDNTRVVFDLSGPVQYGLSSETSRVVLNIEDARLLTGFERLKLGNTPISGIRVQDQGNGRLRLVLELSAAVTPKSFSLPPNQRYGHRLVLDLFDSAPLQAAPVAASAPVPVSNPAVGIAAAPARPGKSSRTSGPPTGSRPVVVAIDAGHGGEDPGALGAGGLQEKDVVLAVARELQRAIDREPGFRAVMVRTGDYQIPLRRRPQIAREKGADLFVSIHADAYEKRGAVGASVYALSDKGASSETARWLADSENAADLIGGVHTNDDDLNAVLLDLSMTGVMASSSKVGGSVLRSLRRITTLHRSHVERAAFVVLKSPDIPSILVETGFISNPSEARRLNTRAYQQSLAQAVHAGIRQYFREHPPEGTQLAAQRGGGSRSTEPARAAASSGPRLHVVRNGESLGSIAQRYGIGPQALRNANKLRSDALAVGQKLKIPQAPAVKR